MGFVTSVDIFSPDESLKGLVTGSEDFMYCTLKRYVRGFDDLDIRLPGVLKLTLPPQPFPFDPLLKGDR